MEATFSFGGARTSCSERTVASTSADLQEYVGKVATDSTVLPMSSLRSRGSSAKAIDGASRTSNATLRCSSTKVSSRAQSRESSKTSVSDTITFTDGFYIKIAKRRGASGSPANNQPIGATVSTRDTPSSSRGQRECRLAALDLEEDEEEDEYESKRPHVPHLAVNQIVKMREMFGELDMKYDYRCDSPPSTSGSSTSLEFREAAPGPCSDFTEEHRDLPSKSLDRLRAARQSVLRRHEENNNHGRPPSCFCRLLRAVVPGGPCCQEQVRKVNEDFYRISSV